MSSSLHGGRIEVAEALERGVGRRIEVGRAAGQRGQARAIAFMTLPEATRVAMPLASAGKTGMSASQPAGSSPRMLSPQLFAPARGRPRA